MALKRGEHRPSGVVLTPANDPLLGLHYAETCDRDLEKIVLSQSRKGYRWRCQSCNASKYAGVTRAEALKGVGA